MVEAIAYRVAPGAIVDLFVDYRGAGPLFDAVDRYYHSHDVRRVNATNFSGVEADPTLPPENHRHAQLRDVPMNASFVYVRLADSDGVAVSDVAEVRIANGSRLEGAWGPGNSVRVEVRTLWELISAMRDPSVRVVALRSHVGLRGVALPVIGPGRDVTIVGECDNPTGPRDARVSGVSRRRARRLQQVIFTDARQDPYGTPNASGDLYGPEAQPLIYKRIAEILDVRRFLNETPPFGPSEEHPDWPVYPSDALHYEWDSKPRAETETPFAKYARGSRFDALRPIEYFAAGTTYAFGSDAEAVGPLGGPGMDVPDNLVDGARVVPLANRCVIDGLDAARLFTVGDPDAPECAWPAPRLRRFPGARGGAVPEVTRVDARVTRARRWYDDRAGARTDDVYASVETATGSYSPWGNQAAGSAAGFKARTPRCGRLALERLVLRGGWSATSAGAAALVVGGELSVRDCVVEGHRTAVAAGRGGAVANKGGRLQIFNSVFRDNVAARGRNGTENVSAGLLAKNPGDDVYHYHSGSLQVDQDSRFGGRPWRVNAATEEMGA